MELDELKTIWNEQEDQETEYAESELIDIVSAKMDKLEQSTRKRDRLEIIASVVLIAIFGYLLVTSPSIWTKLGSVIIMASAVYIIYKLKSAQLRQLRNPASVDIPMDEHLQRELKRIKQQRKLLKGVAWWYIAPLTVGLLFITFGGDSGLWFKIGYMVFVLVFGVVVWWLNQRVVNQKFEPLISEIKEAIEVVENGK
ncbi:MAG: hypothetical protein U5K69_20555 [Balneolaceae bacterium]|nr:hypothetical protein [Balneolaceae bacterium]